MTLESLLSESWLNFTILSISLAPLKISATIGSSGLFLCESCNTMLSFGFVEYPATHAVDETDATLD